MIRIKDSKLKMGRSRSAVLWGRVLSCALIVYIAYGLAIYWFKLTFVIPDGINYWQFTEWLINYEGGFVRRGLLGEMLYWFCSHTGISARYSISFICLGLYTSLFYFFWKKFRERRLCWWFLASPLMFGYVDSVIRKDFLLLWLFVGILMLLKEENPNIWRRLAAGITIVFCLFMHEAFIFFGAPLVLLLLADGRHKLLFILITLSVISVFILMCLYNGSHDIVQDINTSWNMLFGTNELVYNSENSIGALEWESISTFKRHFKRNIGYPYHCIGLFVRPIAMFFAYYIMINFLQAFRKENSAYTETDKTNIGAVYLFLTACMIPMWTVLSCDNLRLYQYISICTIASFLVLSQKRIVSIFPSFYLKFIKKLNNWIELYIPISKGWMLIVFLFWFDGPSWYSLDIGFEYSIFGKLSVLVGTGLQYVYYWLS